MYLGLTAAQHLLCVSPIPVLLYVLCLACRFTKEECQAQCERRSQCNSYVYITKRRGVCARYVRYDGYCEMWSSDKDHPLVYFDDTVGNSPVFCYREKAAGTSATMNTSTTSTSLRDRTTHALDTTTLPATAPVEGMGVTTRKSIVGTPRTTNDSQATAYGPAAETNRNLSQTGVWVTVIVIVLACGVSLVGVATRRRSAEYQQRNPKRQLITNNYFEQEKVSGRDAEASLTSSSSSNPGNSQPAADADKQTTLQLNMPMQPLHYLRNGKAKASAHPQNQFVPRSATAGGTATPSLPTLSISETRIAATGDDNSANPDVKIAHHDLPINVLDDTPVPGSLFLSREPSGTLTEESKPVPVFMESAVSPQSNPEHSVPNRLSAASIPSLLEQTGEQMPMGSLTSLDGAQGIQIDDADINSLELSLPYSSADREGDSADALLERPAKNLDFLFSDNSSNSTDTIDESDILQTQGPFPPGMKVLLETCGQDNCMMVSALFAATKM